MGKVVHRLSNVDADTKTADCAGCGRVEITWRKGKNRWICREGDRQYERKRYYNSRRIALRDELLQVQDGKCAICHRSDLTYTLDHCHRTNYIRQVLCNSCNLAIGLLQDDPEIIRKAASYVEHHEGRTDSRISF